jgi:chromate transporter
VAPNTPSASQSTPPPFGAALFYWLKLGFINFGGPAGQIAMMSHELLDRRK